MVEMMHFIGGVIIPRQVLCPWRAHLLASTLPAVNAPHGSSHRQLGLRQVAPFPEELGPRAATGTVCVTSAQRSHCSLRRSHRAWPHLAA